MATQNHTSFSTQTYHRVVMLSIIGAIALTLGSKLSIQATPLPITLQLLALGLLIALYPGRLVLSAMVLWLAVGFVAPVHAMPGTSTLHMLQQPAGGYMLGLALAASLSFLGPNLLAKLLLSLLLVHMASLLWLLNSVPPADLFEHGLKPYIGLDIIKVGLALAVGMKLSEARDNLRAWALGPPRR